MSPDWSTNRADGTSTTEPLSWTGRPERSGPELAGQRGVVGVERAVVDASGQVFPAAVGDHERDVRRLALAGHGQGRVQRRAGGQAGEEALDLDQFAGAPQRVG